MYDYDVKIKRFIRDTILRHTTVTHQGSVFLPDHNGNLGHLMLSRRGKTIGRSKKEDLHT